MCGGTERPWSICAEKRIRDLEATVRRLQDECDNPFPYHGIV
jgi:hypothetical protein